MRNGPNILETGLGFVKGNSCLSERAPFASDNAPTQDCVLGLCKSLRSLTDFVYISRDSVVSSFDSNKHV